MVMKHLRRFAWPCATCLAASALLVTASAQKADKDSKSKEQDAILGANAARLFGIPV